VVLVTAAAFIPTIVQYISTRTNAQTHVVVVNNAGTVAGLDETTLISTIGTDLNGANPAGSAPYAITVQPQASLDNLRDQVKNGKVDILLVLDRAADGDLVLTYYSHASPANDSHLPAIQIIAQQLTFLDTAQQLGLTSAQVRNLLAPPTLTVVRTQTPRPKNELVAGYALAFAGSYLCFFAVAGYAGNVAQGVAEEKGNRVMEILVNAATPFQLMVGKIAGIGAACLTQMACLVAVGIVALLVQTPLQAALFGANKSGFIKYLTGVSIPFYLFFLIYFLLSFFMYASVYAGLGALVRRTEEVQSVVMVPTTLLVAGFAVTYLGAASPDADWVTLLSYIPFFTPSLILVRLALGTVAWWEIALTIALMLATICAFALISARLYRYGILMYGQRPGLGQLMEMIRVN
jgi:ABC-2 type transport system permease protein